MNIARYRLIKAIVIILPIILTVFYWATDFNNSFMSTILPLEENLSVLRATTHFLANLVASIIIIYAPINIYIAILYSKIVSPSELKSTLEHYKNNTVGEVKKDIAEDVKKIIAKRKGRLSLLDCYRVFNNYECYLKNREYFNERVKNKKKYEEKFSFLFKENDHES